MKFRNFTAWFPAAGLRPLGAPVLLPALVAPPASERLRGRPDCIRLNFSICLKIHIARSANPPPMHAPHLFSHFIPRHKPKLLRHRVRPFATPCCFDQNLHALPVEELNQAVQGLDARNGRHLLHKLVDLLRFPTRPDLNSRRCSNSVYSLAASRNLHLRHSQTLVSRCKTCPPCQLSSAQDNRLDSIQLRAADHAAMDMLLPLTPLHGYSRGPREIKQGRKL